MRDIEEIGPRFFRIRLQAGYAHRAIRPLYLYYPYYPLECRSHRGNSHPCFRYRTFPDEHPRPRFSTLFATVHFEQLRICCFAA